ncbi:hypothetical protein [Antrihabitans sp. YC2-6]|uniref:hypothetical protein n=1 Tax=Antrihabitans sp. YC2-6 TaxID=2799498 RepID=UPI0018F7310F|nr:hypothetical protein [Antrihabitans sp. YC2-6]MBJ8343883.1 hypothetical protein [Antrihabitans sp. YC2-6]
MKILHALRQLTVRPTLTPFRCTVIVLFATAVVFAVLAGSQLQRHHESENERTRDAEILATARSGVTAMISIRDVSAAADVQKVLDQSTGTFKNDFQARATAFIGVVEEAKVVTQGDVLAEGIESRTRDSAVVLVSATSTVSNAAGAADETRNWRLRVTMTDDEGQYKMSNVEFVA